MIALSAQTQSRRPEQAMSRLLSLGLLLALALPTSALAVLVEVDLDPGSGDRDLTRDTTTALEWLDLEFTLGLSVAEVESGAGGWVDDGFRVAEISEVLALHQGLGIFPTLLEHQAQIEAFAPTMELARLLGCSVPVSCAPSNFVGFQTVSAFASADVLNPALPGFVWGSSIEQTIFPDDMRAIVGHGNTIPEGLSSGTFGVYLVRAVPESSPVLLMLVGTGFSALFRAAVAVCRVGPAPGESQ